MADIKFSQLTAAAVGAIGATTTILPVSINVTTTPLSRSITAGVLRDWLSTNFAAITASGAITAAGFTSAAGPVSLGATPPATGAIRVDAASYGTFGIRFSSGATDVGSLVATAGGVFSIIAETLQVLDLWANNDPKWRINTEAAGTSTISSRNATARIVGGATNGLAIRNSANTRDNFSVNDAGTNATLTNGTQAALIVASGASGERTAGGVFSSAGQSAWIGPDSSTVGLIAGGCYWDGTQYRSALEVANVASGFSTLSLMRSGGNVIIGNGAASVGNLLFGGTTASFPQIRRSGTSLVFETAGGGPGITIQTGVVRLTTAAGIAAAGVVAFGNATQTTVGAAGGASALPATPSGYLRFFLGTTEFVLPYYAQA